MNNNHLLILNDVCRTCHLENYRETLNEIIGDIFARGCQVSLVRRKTSQFRNKEQMGNTARIFLGYLNKKDPLEAIWALLKEFGHFINEPFDISKKEIPAYKFSREQFAWGFARDQVVKYPELRPHMDRFTAYRMANRCI